MITKLLSLLAKIIWIKELGVLSGLALILSIYVHEYGHYLMADLLKLEPKYQSTAHIVHLAYSAEYGGNSNN